MAVPDPFSGRSKAGRSSSEPERIAALISSVMAGGVRADPVMLTHCYIAVKSRPLAILLGPESSEKLPIVNALAQVLVGPDPIRFQRMDGHAWWAARSSNTALFTQAQTRFNTTKLLALIDEALEPRNARHLYLACMMQISQAELIGYFGSLGFQLQHGEFIRLPAAHFTKPRQYPANLLLIGTMDSARLAKIDFRALQNISLIFCSDEIEERPASVGKQPYMLEGEPDFRNWIRSEDAADLKLADLQYAPTRIAQPLKKILPRLEDRGISFSPNLWAQIKIYLANCWSVDGTGLYASEQARNYEIARDMALYHSMLPECLRAIFQSRIAPGAVARILGEHFPRTKAVLSSIFDGM